MLEVSIPPAINVCSSFSPFFIKYEVFTLYILQTQKSNKSQQKKKKIYTTFFPINSAIFVHIFKFESVIWVTSFNSITIGDHAILTLHQVMTSACIMNYE